MYNERFVKISISSLNIEPLNVSTGSIINFPDSKVELRIFETITVILCDLSLST